MLFEVEYYFFLKDVGLDLLRHSLATIAKCQKRRAEAGLDLWALAGGRGFGDEPIYLRPKKMASGPQISRQEDDHNKYK